MTTSQCKFARTVNPDDYDHLTSRPAAEAAGVAQNTVLAHRRRTCPCFRNEENTIMDAPAPRPTIGQKAHMELGPDGGTFDGIESTEPLTNWDHVFARFKLDPAEFEIVNDTVKMSVWNNGREDDETGELIDLYSYRATFRRLAKQDTAHYDDLIDHLRGYVPAPRLLTTGKPVTAVVGLADWQIGKGEGDGTPGTVRRILSGLDATQGYLEQMTASGYKIEQILLANLGDHTEATHGSYSNQPSTVDLNLREQINTAIDLNMKWITAMRDYAPVRYDACLCNHGQLSRVGHDPVMGDADNATGLIGDQLTHICGYIPNLRDVQFNIPQDEMITTATVSGVNIAMAHGHKITGKEETWLAQQSQALVHRERFIPDLWFTAHKHHANVVDLGPYTRIQATTTDPGSKWLLDSKGLYSTPGTTVFLAGESLPMKWDQYRVLA